MSYFTNVMSGGGAEEEGRFALARSAIDACVCPICLDVMVLAVITKCGHSFCKACLQQCLQSSQRCPECRALVHDIMDNYCLRKIIDRRERGCEGCGQFFPQHKFDTHFDTCGQRSLQCPCGWVGTLATQQEHPTECALLISCSCGWAGSPECQTSHLQRCPDRIKCLRCAALIDKANADEHETQCSAEQELPEIEELDLPENKAQSVAELDWQELFEIERPVAQTAMTCPICHVPCDNKAVYMAHMSQSECSSGWKYRRLEASDAELTEAVNLGVNMLCISTNHVHLSSIIGPSVTVLDINAGDYAINFDNCMPVLRHLSVVCKKLSLRSLPRLTKLRAKFVSLPNAMECFIGISTDESFLQLENLDNLSSVHLAGVNAIVVTDILKQYRTRLQLESLKLHFDETVRADAFAPFLNFGVQRLKKLGLIWPGNNDAPQLISRLANMTHLVSLQLGGLRLPRDFLKALSGWSALKKLQLQNCTFKAVKYVPFLLCSSAFKLGEVVSRLDECEIVNCPLDDSFFAALKKNTPMFKTFVLKQSCGKVPFLRLMDVRNRFVIRNLCLAFTPVLYQEFCLLKLCDCLENLDICGLSVEPKDLKEARSVVGGLCDTPPSHSQIAEMQRTDYFPALPRTLRALDMSFVKFFGRDVPLSLHWIKYCTRLRHVAAVGQFVFYQNSDDLFNRLHTFTIDNSWHRTVPPHLVVNLVDAAEYRSFKRSVVDRINHG